MLAHLTIACLLTTAANAVDTTVNPQLVASLKGSATQLDRLKLLSSDSDWLFDFKAQESYTYTPGSVVNANVATFPALTTMGMTMAMLNLGPCAMLPPHMHPRATNLVVAVEGTTNTYMMEENGARVVKQTLTPGKMTIFPQGSLHTMQNTGCTNATLVSALNSEDQGTLNLLNSLYMFPDDLVKASYGGGDFGAAASGIPPVGTGSIVGSAECLAACKNGSSYTGH
ncbi:RmlC-like cupin domain-containing protein [Rhexocercosporidium sp. MPI-PUGE-AT-0058]|nr:RmlC-like cupin domain-containing protein [Rhexocercosporidium sp. MPI-PUGE-AT-0058]